MFKRPLSEEARYTIILCIIVTVVPVLFYYLNTIFNPFGSTPPVQKEKERIVIVSEAEKANILSRASVKPVTQSVRDAISQGDYSTAYLQLSKLPPNSPESEELHKQLDSTPRARKIPGVRKDTVSPQSPLRYLDESTPRDRFSDGLYFYVVEISGTVWPKFCIQTVGDSRLNMTGFRIKADGKTFSLPAVSVKSTKTLVKVAEYYDIPVDQQIYNIIQALIKARKASLTCIGKSDVREREITDSEKKGLERMIQAYTTLGGNFAFFGH